MASQYITVSTKGQVIIPSEVREMLHIEPGTKLAMRIDEGTIVLQPITDEFIESLRGCSKGLGLGDLREKMHREYKAL